MELVYKDAFKVVGVLLEADWESLWIEMPRAWKSFLERQGEIEGRVDDGFMDISLREEDGAYQQLICAEVSELAAAPQGMVGMEIPRQRYLHQRHSGPVEEIADTFGRMYDWAKENRLRAGSFKIDKGYTLEGQAEEHELYIRVEG